MAIGNDNLWSGAWSALESFITTNVTDPRGRYKETWVHAGYPNINAKGYNGFPFIVLRVEFSEDKPAIDLVTTKKIGLITFEVVSNSSVEVDSISDQLYYQIKQEGNLEEFKVKSLDASPTDFALDENSKKVYNRVLGMMGVFRI